MYRHNPKYQQFKGPNARSITKNQYERVNSKSATRIIF